MPEELDKRKKKILQAIIEEYIETAEPVSSGNLVKELDCSSATIRNEMAELEQIGFIEKPHTSAGRIPSQKGYRYYVDELIRDDKLSRKEMEFIKERLETKINALEDLTRIGNKLEYTDEKGELVKRQSIADFNVNAPTAIIRKETFIDESRIPDLLGYIYEDMESFGTEKLPIPSINVDIYIPRKSDTTVSMYNGTSLDFTLDEIKKNRKGGERTEC